MIPRILEPEVMDTAEEAGDYDKMDHTQVNQFFVDDLVRFIDQADSMSGQPLDVVDIGTGTALIPLELLRRKNAIRSMLACDLSMEMLKVAWGHLFEHAATSGVLPVYCDCKHLPVADASCQVVMSNSIVHHIPDPHVVFVEMRRVLKPGGVLFIRDLMRPESTQDVERLVATYAGQENAEQQQLFRQSLHAALTIEEVQLVLRKIGLPLTAIQQTSDRHWTVSCIV